MRQERRSSEAEVRPKGVWSARSYRTPSSTTRSMIRHLILGRQTQLALADIAHRLTPLLRGWIEYYGRYAPSALYPLLRYVNQTLLAWAMRKFKRFKDHKIRTSRFLQRLAADR